MRVRSYPRAISYLGLGNDAEIQDFDVAADSRMGDPAAGAYDRIFTDDSLPLESYIRVESAVPADHDVRIDVGLVRSQDRDPR